MGRTCSTHGELRNAYKILITERERKRPHGKPRRRWEDYVPMDLREIECVCGLDASGSGQGPVAGSCENGNELSGSLKGVEFFD
jgi:hypothetical protein